MYPVQRLQRLPARIAAVSLALAALASCRSAGAGGRPTIVQPGAPGASSRVITAEQATDVSRVQHTPADVQFMQRMIGHHSQAIDMTTLLASRTASESMRKLALRIEVSQADEIDMMKRWLAARGQEAPDPHVYHMHGAVLMPGMLTQEEMDRLSAAEGAAFDRLFLEFMIKHHEGALIMVKELFSTPGAGQESEIFAFATDVDADQRMEIDRMRTILKEFQK